LTDIPAATTWHQTSNYAGGQGDAHAEAGPNAFSGGFYSFFQAENDLFGVVDNATTPPTIYPNTSAQANAGLVEFYLADHLRLGKYITLLGGERFSIYRAGLNETAIYPRIGATVMIPHLNWVFRGFYGHFFQPAPVQTVSSSVLNYAGTLPGGENTFTPLPSERDEEHQFGVQIPVRGWILDIDTFKNRVNNFLDHSNLGESNMYFPIAVDGALVRAWEMTLRSPATARWGQFHVTYSNQIAEQRGNIIGGFTCTLPNDPACDLGPDYTPVDHDQRDTLNVGFTARLPLKTWFSSNVYYGSGFSNGLAGSGEGPYQGPYLPVHTTFDVSAGRNFGERWRAAVNVVNVTNHRVLLDNSVTIGGFHYNDPRMISAELRYRFHF
jgi:outer membrane receptor protein involved in Fe transport